MEYSDLTPGEHRFRVRAIDIAGNVEHPPVTRTFSIGMDAVPPETTIQTGPPASVPDDWASFEFSSNELDATFECAIDGEPFEECFNPAQYVELEPGQHTFSVRAIDTSLNPDPTPATWTWTYEPPNPAPETTIVSHPTNPSTSITAVFQFASVGPEIEFECALDAEPFESCESPYLIEDLTPGVHSLLVRAVDVNLNVDPTPASFTWRVIAPPLEPTIVSAPADPSTGNSHTFAFTSDEPNATFECRITPNPFHQNTFTPCSSPHTYTALPDGEYLFEVRAVNEFGIAGEIPAEWSFEVANAPDTTILSGPSGTTESTTGAIAFASSEPGSTFECSLDGEAFTECLSPAVFPDTELGWPELSVGTHTFLVQAVDIDGNVDPTPASRTWTVVEATRPETTIVAGPQESTSDTTATVSFASTEPGSTFECSLDGGAYAACTSPHELSGLSVGTHELRVVATDGDGDADLTPAAYTWTVVAPDTEAPDTRIDTAPEDPTNLTDASFVFASEPGATYECALDGGAWTACAFAMTYLDLAAGPHTFAVRATDASGNTDESPATHAWIVDVTAPDTEITGQPGDPSRGDFVSFAFAGSDAVSAAGDHEFECRLDAGPWVDCASPRSYGSLAAGPHTFSVRAIDEAGNVDAAPATYAWTVDTVAPETTVESGPPSTTTSTSATIVFSSETGASHECRIDDGAYEPCSSPAEYSGLAQGDHTFSVRATDAAGNTDPSPATRSWTIDLPPDTTIDSGPDDPTASATASFSFSSSDAGSSYECALDSQAFSSCSANPEFRDLAPGEHELLVRAKDPAGNVDPTPASSEWTILAPPQTTIDSIVPAAAETETTSATFTFSSDQPGSTFRCSLDGAEPTLCSSPKSYTGLALGSHDFEVHATGPAGNSDPTPANYGWEIGDLTPPVITLGAAPPATTESTTATFTFSVDDPDAVLQCSLDGAEPRVCESPKTYTEADLAAATGTAIGAHTLEITATKHHLLVAATPVSHEWAVEDLTAPQTTIESGPEAETPLGTPALFTLSSNESGAAFECAVDPAIGGPVWSTCATAPDNTVELDIALAGVHTVLVRAVDASGNADETPASYTWTVVGAPVTAIQSGPADGSVSTDRSATFEFAADQAGATYECSLDGAVFAACTSPATYEGLGIGEHTFEVQATNRFDLVEAPARSRTWTIEPAPDTVAPETAIDSGPDVTTGSTSATLTFSGTDAGTPAAELSFECSLDSALYVACTSPHALQGLAAGAHELRVRAIDLAGNVDQTPALRSWTVEAPETAILSGPGSSTATATATFHFSSSDPIATFECSLNGAALSSCNSPHVVADLVPGAYELVVVATNAAGTADPTPATYTWTVVAPDTRVDSAPPAATRATTADFRFSSTDLAASYECALDGATFSSCDSHLQLEGLTVGAHELLVRAVSTAGTLDESPASHLWTVEAPQTTITSGPAERTFDTHAIFVFSSDDPLATFECSLEGDTSWSSCESPYQLTGVVPGNYELLVRALNSEGGADPTPASYRWTVAAPPDTTLLTTPDAQTDETTATFTFESDQQGVTFECALDEAADDLVFTPCDSPQTYTDLIFGEHDFAVRARDAEGHVDLTPAEYHWNIGGVAPPVTIDSAPDARTDSRSATFAFSAEGRNLQFECALDGGSFALCDSPRSYSGLSLAPHTFQVRVYVEEPVAEPEITTYTWSVVELDPPETTILLAPPDPSDSRTASFAFDSDEAVVTFECSLDGAAYEPCPVPSDFLDLHNGEHTLLVRAVDAYENRRRDAGELHLDRRRRHHPAGDHDPGRAGRDHDRLRRGLRLHLRAGRDLRVLARRRAVRLLQLARRVQRPGARRPRVPRPRDRHAWQRRGAGQPRLDDRARHDAARDDAAREAAGDHHAPRTPRSASRRTSSGAEFECSLDGEPFSGCDNPEQLTDLTVGEHTFEVRAIDLADPPNVDPTPGRHTWTIQAPPDTTPPETRILSGPPAVTIDTVAPFTFRRRGRLHLRMLARRRAVRRVRVARGVQRRGAGRPRAPGRRHRPRRQRRPDAGRLQLDRRGRARDGDRLRPRPRPAPPRAPRSPSPRPGRRELLLLARRARGDALHLAEDLQRARRRRAHLRGRGAQRARRG